MRVAVLLLTPIILFAKVHYAKVEPYESITLKSAISAQVVGANIELEGKNIERGVIVQLDDKLDKIKLKSDREALGLIKKMLKITRDNINALSESLDRQRSYYERIEGISTIAINQKDKAFYTYINTQSQYLSAKEKLETLKRQKLDLLYDIEKLKDNISKKSIRVKDKFLYKLLVHRGDFVNMGMPVAEVRDLTKAKLTIFLELDELKGIKTKKIYIDGKETSYKISKIWSVTDSKFISSYRAEIVIKNFHGKFSQLLKVEFK